MGALAAGVLVLGRLANTDLVAMLLTSVWFGLVFVVAYAYAYANALARRRRALLVPMVTGYSASALAAGVLLGLPLITDRTVDEDVLTGEPLTPAAAPADASNSAKRSAPARPSRNVRLASGEFVPLAHDGAATASVVELATGGRRVTLTAVTEAHRDQHSGSCQAVACP